MVEANEFLDFVDPNVEFLKTYLKDGELDALVKGCQEVLDRSYSPYSNFKVGACVLTHSGEYYKGTNLENLNFSCSVHAEAAAFTGALVKGVTGKKIFSHEI